MVTKDHAAGVTDTHEKGREEGKSRFRDNPESKNVDSFLIAKIGENAVALWLKRPFPTPSHPHSHLRFVCPFETGLILTDPDPTSQDKPDLDPISQDKPDPVS